MRQVVGLYAFFLNTSQADNTEWEREREKDGMIRAAKLIENHAHAIHV